ncbi:aminopeptidase P family protein [Planktotalea arctica]|uniref:aminopeptidase P family protein n=1 Tax=Planktotalea arctica TaxID=1481893 RepID=UPI000A173ADF|nr:aminopeptidase P family protein [Planktotalea arctica]
MFQSFDTPSTPEYGPARLTSLRTELAQEDLDGFLIPRADAHQGEYVAPRDERLKWLTGFTGSAGFCCALRAATGVFIDGRYRTQVKSQVDLEHFTPVHWPEVSLADWLKERLPSGGIVGFDPWLMTQGQLEAHETALLASGITLRPCANLVDRIWDDQPEPPMSPAYDYPLEYAGKSSSDKRTECAGDLAAQGEHAAVITLPDSLCWLLNIRGGDVAKTPLVQGFAILQSDARVALFVAPSKFAALDPDPTLHIAPPEGFVPALTRLSGKVRCDKTSVPVAVIDALQAGDAQITYGSEPCALPKACKNAVEIAGTRTAHIIDATAMCELLCWLDQQPAGSVTEIDVVRELEARRRATKALQDISFDTIAGSGPNGAIMHYRVTHDSARSLQTGDLLVLDSGGQYLNGTTDITRTCPVGDVGLEERSAFTRVLQGMIAVSRMRWPKGLAGRDIEAVGRMPLWLAGQDFDHGLGHGVGHFLGVHEGPQRLSRASHVPLEPGMILSNEPGYYREGAFGIRIENLLVVREAPALEGGDSQRAMYDFETLTFVPIDRRLIRRDMLSRSEINWLDAYHAACRDKLSNDLSACAEKWLEQACKPL